MPLPVTVAPEEVNEQAKLRYLLQQILDSLNAEGATGNVSTADLADSAVTTAKIAAANVTLAKLASGITPSHVAKYAGKITWSGSGATLNTAVAGVVAGDIVVATIQTKPTQAAYLVGAVPSTDQIALELSAANTSNNAVIAYVVFRAAA